VGLFFAAVATYHRPPDLHKGGDGHGNVGGENIAAHKAGRLQGEFAQQADAALTDVLDPSDELHGSGCGATDGRQTSALHFQRVRKANVLTSFSFRWARHHVMMREPL